MEDFIKLILLPIGILFFLLYIFIGGVNNWSKSQLRQSCYSFSQQSGYETKYVEYTHWSYDCLAKQTDGRWISTDNIRFNTQKQGE